MEFGVILIIMQNMEDDTLVMMIITTPFSVLMTLTINQLVMIYP